MPKSLSDLENLKAIILEQCRQLVDVPDVGKLKALRELNLTGTMIKEVPQGMEKLVNLKCLSIEETENFEMLPKGLLLKLPYLQRLYLPDHLQAPVEEIEMLKQLEEFIGRVKDVSDFNQFIRSRQSKEYNISYNITVGGEDTEAMTSDDMDFKAATVCGCDLKKEEAWKYVVFQDLLIQKFEGLSNYILDDLHNPSFLKSLQIHDCEGIQGILNWTTNEQQLMEFQLEDIELQGLPDFMGIIKWEIGAAVALTHACAFSSLRQVGITKCDKMKNLGLPLSGFANLEQINVCDCEEIEEIIQVGDDHAVVSLPKLKYLRLQNLPGLKSICKATMICGSIEITHLWECPALGKLPLFFPHSTIVDEQPYCYSPPLALKEICILKEEKEWWESLEWEHPTHYHLLQPFLQFS